MSSISEITNQIRACNVERVRVVLDPDDAVALVAYLEAQGYMSADAIAALEAETKENHGAYHAFLESQGMEIDKAPDLSGADDDAQAAHRAKYIRWLKSEDGVKAVAAEKARVEAAAKAEAGAKAKAEKGKGK